MNEPQFTGHLGTCNAGVLQVEAMSNRRYCLVKLMSLKILNYFED